MTYDYLVVGAGFAGSVVAERLADAGQTVLVIDRRPHVAGNAFDCVDSAGLRIHAYGPHIFHTNSTRVFQYLSRFTTWRQYEHRVLASVDGALVPMPVSARTVNQLFGLTLTSADLVGYLESVVERRSARTAEDAVLTRMGRRLYDRLFKNYTRKQWGLEPSQLDASVTARIPVRFTDDDRYFTDRYQVMPAAGFSCLFGRLLSHPAIHVQCDADFRDLPTSVRYRTLVYTGAIDDFFGHCFGRLPYRSLRFVHMTVDRPEYQPVAVVNHPNDHAYTRVTEFKHITGQQHPRTSIAFEYPQAAGDPFYPVLHDDSRAQYGRYAALAARTPGVHFTGRLGTFRYYNMDQVVAQSLTLARRLLRC